MQKSCRVTATQSIIKITEQSVCFRRPKSRTPPDAYGALCDWGTNCIKLSLFFSEYFNVCVCVSVCQFVSRDKFKDTVTFLLPHELVERLEACPVIDVIRLERDAEEVAVRLDCLLLVVILTATQSVHLTILQLNVEVGELNVVTLCALRTPGATTVVNDHWNNN